METRGRAEDRNGAGSGDGNERISGDGNGDEDGNRNGNEDRIGKGGEEAKKCKNSHASCRRHVANGGDLGGKRKNVETKGPGPVAANLDNLENNKEAGGGAPATRA